MSMTFMICSFFQIVTCVIMLLNSNSNMSKGCIALAGHVATV